MNSEMIKAIQGMDKADLDKALKSLNKRDYDTIQALSLALENNVKDKSAFRSRRVMFGYWAALEVLAKLGILFCDLKIEEISRNGKEV